MREIFLGFFFGFFFGGPREERKIAHPLFFAHFKQTVFSLSLFYFFFYFFTGASASRESLLALRRTRDLVRLKDSEKVFEKVFFFLFEEFEKQKTHIFFNLSLSGFTSKTPHSTPKQKNRITLSSLERKDTTESGGLESKKPLGASPFSLHHFFLFFLLSLSIHRKAGKKLQISLTFDR